MTRKSKEYVSGTQKSGWRVAGTRVSIDSVIHAYWEGYPPEVIAADFPTLSLEKIYGTIAFYLAHRKEVDSYLAKQMGNWDRHRKESETRNGPLLQRIRQMRQTSVSRATS